LVKTNRDLGGIPAGILAEWDWDPAAGSGNPGGILGGNKNPSGHNPVANPAFRAALIPN